MPPARPHIITPDSTEDEMEHFVIEVEIDRPHPTDDDEIDTIVDAITPLGGALGATPTGTMQITLTLPANDLTQALALATRSLSGYGPFMEVRALPQRVWEARQAWVSLPEFMSVPEAAQVLGVTRQQTLNDVRSGRLQGVKVGRDWILPAEPVRAARLARSGIA